MSPPPLAVREQHRDDQFRSVWTQELDAVFADVAPYYDRANSIASLGLWKRSRFSTPPVIFGWTGSSARFSGF